MNKRARHAIGYGILFLSVLAVGLFTNYDHSAPFIVNVVISFAALMCALLMVGGIALALWLLLS